MKREIIRNWTLKEIAYLREHYPNTNSIELAEAMNRTKDSIRGMARKLRLKKSRIWKQREINVLLNYYKTHSSYEIAEMLGNGRTHRSVLHKLERLGISKLNAIRERKGWIEKKHEAKPKPKPKRKCKSQSSPRQKPIGTIVIRMNKQNQKFKMIKFAEPNKWMMLNRNIWEKHNGKMPPKHIIRHKDGNKLNCDIDNLVLMSLAENLKLNWNHKKSAKTRKRISNGGFYESVLMGVV